ncbi:ligand-binding sensor domain-containing protein [Marilutibacter chinensis]|uniref:Two component regulator three Y domain-containing protein n=1 Tax=Marilutibacter chinensis TaxID=2912247 RepID=A0ABS9HSH9_9GAMM|nr:two-component regulator propeller domain-containing protein [Lysobacter chinensis]MCF7221633.1 hypothetical protein [Lysobacter chinensis]
MTRRMALALGLLAACGLAQASYPVKPDHRLSPKVFTGDDGLPQSGVSALVQTRDGYLWVGTFGGLARFDGRTFTTFRGRPSPGDGRDAGRGQTGGPASDRILVLFEDDADRLWIGTEDAGLSVYERGAFRHLPVCAGTCQINDILQGTDGAIWVASKAGLFKLDPEDLGVVWSESPVRAGYDRLASDGEGRIHVGGYGGFHIVDEGRLQRLQRLRLPGEDRAVRLLESSGDSLLVGTEKELYRYDPAHRRWQALGVDRPTYAAQDDDGLWWVAQLSGRFVRQDAAGAWKDVPELSGMGVISLAWDDEGDLWAGSGSKGLLRTRKPLFGVLSSAQLGTNMAGRAVVADGDGGLWFGSACGGVHHWSHEGHMRALTLEKVLGSGCVTSLLLDRNGWLWAGSAEGGLARIAGDEPEFVATWPTLEPVNIWQREDGSYLVSSGRSMYVIAVDAEGGIVGSRRIDALQGMRINSVVAAARGGTWFVGDHGVLRMRDGEIVERWSVREGLSSRFARALYEDRDTGTLWVGTYGGGLNRIENGKVHHYGTANGLFDDTVSCILADQWGRLWLGGNRGVTLLPSPRDAQDEIESVGYATGDGLVPAEINGGASSTCHRDGHGWLWFSLVEGFGVIDPADVSATRAATLKPHIEHVAAAGRVLDIASPTLTLEPFTRNLEIRYTAINLSRPQETRFRFRLSGVDGDWVEAGQNRSILYPSVPWGEHVFEVQARVAGGAWSPASASLRIVHPQPWYQRMWVWTLVMLLGLLVLVGSTHLESTRTADD